MKRIARNFASQTVSGRNYQANVSVDCTCPGYSARKHCRHVRELAGELIPAVVEKPGRQPGQRRRRTFWLPVECHLCQCSGFRRDKSIPEKWRCLACDEPAELRKVTTP